jgi:hypothetical protein
MSLRDKYLFLQQLGGGFSDIGAVFLPAPLLPGLSALRSVEDADPRGFSRWAAAPDRSPRRSWIA